MPFTAGQRLLASTLNTNMPQLLGSTILSSLASNISISIPAGFNHLQGIFTGRQDSGSGGAGCFMTLNGDNGANYTWQLLRGNFSTVTALNSNGAATMIQMGVLPGSGDAANYFGTGNFTIGNVSSAVFKPLTSSFQGPVASNNGWSGSGGGLWASTAAVTSVTFFPSTGNLVTGSSMSIFGWH